MVLPAENLDQKQNEADNGGNQEKVEETIDEQIHRRSSALIAEEAEAESEEYKGIEKAGKKFGGIIRI